MTILRRNARKILRYAFVSVLLIIGITIFIKSLLMVDVIADKHKNHAVEDIDLHRASQFVDLDDKKDWLDHEEIKRDLMRKGPGEQGAAFYLPPETSKKKDELYKVNGFNALVSDYIAINRSLVDIRHPRSKEPVYKQNYFTKSITKCLGCMGSCKIKKYLSKLPTASIVVPFHNEHITTLLRTATSVINRAPPELIEEVILVDDYSNKEELKEHLENYVKEHLKKVRIIRAQRREGLIRARLLGARAAVGDVLIFLDSHTEASVNWLPPLLEPIAVDKRTVVCPFIDVIDFETFAYRAQDEGARGSFDWELFYKRLPLLDEDKEHPAEPFKSPVMAGGLFAIDRSFFWELGGYDEGLDVWGGEQYELSFKIWQCGGQMVDAPCSRIGHIYRKFAPFPNPGIGDFVGRNYKRVAEVWMDEYKEYLYLRRPHYRSLNPGDITKQKELREKLHCKSFKWFMEEIAFDQPKKYPPVEPPDYAFGEIRNEQNNLCIDTKYREQNQGFDLQKCIKDNPGKSGEQQFVLTWHKDIRPKKRNVCFDVSTTQDHAPVVLWNCHGMQGNQQWKYDLVSRHLHHPVSGNCLDCDSERQEIFMNPCSDHLKTQRWIFEKVNRTALKDL